MARHADVSLDDIVKRSIEGVVERVSAAIARSIADTVAQRLEAELKKTVGKGGRSRRGAWQRRPAPAPRSPGGPPTAGPAGCRPS